MDVQHLFSGGETRPDLNPELAVPPSDMAEAGAGSEPDPLGSLLRSAGSLEGIETLMLDYALRQSGGNASAAARLLGLGRGQFDYRRRKRRSVG